MTEVSIQELDTISAKIDDRNYHSLARQLLIRDVDQEKIEEEYGTIGRQEIIYRILKFWKDTQAAEATRQNLITALKNIEQFEAVEMLSSVPGKKEILTIKQEQSKIDYV